MLVFSRGMEYDHVSKIAKVTKATSEIGVNERAVAQINYGRNLHTERYVYFEVEILKSDDEEPRLAIGFAGEGFNNGMTGWYEHSIGFHADDGLVFDSNPVAKEAILLDWVKVGDVMGAVWCKETGVIVFSKNNKFFDSHMFYRSHRGECSDFLPTITCSYNRGLELRLLTSDLEWKMPQKDILYLVRTKIRRNRIITHIINRFQVSMIMSSSLPEPNPDEPKKEKQTTTKERSVVQIIGDTIEVGGIHYFEILLKKPEPKKEMKSLNVITSKNPLISPGTSNTKFGGAEIFFKGSLFDSCKEIQIPVYPDIALGFARRGFYNQKIVGTGMMVGEKYPSVGCHGQTGHIHSQGDGRGVTNIGFQSVSGDVLGVLWDKEVTGMITFTMNGKFFHQELQIRHQNNNRLIDTSPPPRYRSFRHFHNLLPTITLNSGVEFELLMGERCRISKSVIEEYLSYIRLERFRCGPGVRLSNQDIFDADLSPHVDYNNYEEDSEEDSEEEEEEKAQTENDRACVQIIGDTTDIKGMQYFEVEIVDCGMNLHPVIGIGFARLGFKNGMVGWKDYSVGLHADDGGLFNSKGKATLMTGIKLTTGSTFGAVWDEFSGVIRFSCSSKRCEISVDDDDKKKEEEEEEEGEEEENEVKILHKYVFPRMRTQFPGFVPTITLRWERGIRFRVRLGDEIRLKKKELLELRKVVKRK